MPIGFMHSSTTSWT